ncbi:DEAD/DEAH box helicase [Agilicoccus flavus]|uniref:DEAD/DEAH box helicase n=1 Tax=Agilicoccus flavus TaxID=2775968 RepID=UPI001CF6749B|nr:DEAD/DEAH box helicase [Agilicoccus flavus]
MVPPLLDAAWLASLDDAALLRRFGEATFERGRAYARAGRVGALETGDHGRLVTARVAGGDALPYQTLVLAGAPANRGGGARAGLSSRCSCPMRSDCKHVVAVVLRARALAGLTADGAATSTGADGPVLARHPATADATTTDPDGTSDVPAWEALLRHALQAPTGPHPGSADVGEPLALGFSLGVPPAADRWGARPPSREPRLRLRPLRRTRTGRWGRTGAAWEDLDRLLPGRADAAHLEVLRRLAALRPVNRYAYVRAPDHLEVDGLGPAVWALLAEAAGVGVEFVPADRSVTAVRLAPDEARFGIDVRRAPDGGLSLAPRVLLDGVSRPARDVMWCGSPPHGVAFLGSGSAGTHHGAARAGGDGAGVDLVVAGLDARLRPVEEGLVLGPETVHVPAGDVDRFTAAYYPQLRAGTVLLEHDLDLPAPEPPVLTLEARFEEGHQVLLRWGFRYVVGEHVYDVPVVPPRARPAGAGPDDVARDVAAEQRIVDALPTPDSPDGLTTPVGPRRALVPVQRFSGEDTIAVANELLPALARRDDVRVTVVGDPLDYREAEQEPQIRLAVRDAGPGLRSERTDWFDLDVSVEVDGERVPFQALFTALAKGQPRMLLDSGRYFSLASPALHRLRELIEESRHLSDHQGSTLSVRPVHAGLWEDLTAIGVVVEESAAWVRSVGALLEAGPGAAAAAQSPPPESLRATLRPYQLDGFRWLSLLWDAGLGGVLADDMGLGKTLQVLAVAVRAAQRGDLDGAPLLVVAPTSVVGAWEEQAAAFAPDLPVAAITSTTRRRKTPLAQAVGGARLVLTTYAIARLDGPEFAELRWSGVVLDEAQAVKNHRSKTYHAIRRIGAPRRFVVTGTPLENSLMDLWSLLSIAAPGLFPDPETFADVYRRPIEEGTDPAKLERLHRHLRPLVLRRTKEAVAADLPPKQVQVVSVDLSPAHRRVYDRVLHRERQKVLDLLDSGGFEKNRLVIFRSLTTLRLLALAPGLVDASAAPFDTGAPAAGTKIDVLMELLEDVVAGGHRALVFSQFTRFLGMVRERLTAEGIGHVYLDGRTRDRAKRIETFRTGDDPVFCISLKAGGTGLTLTEADYVFILDPWWNPAAEDQAIDRAHRIGQDKHVMVYRLVADATIEDKVVAMQQRKRDLFDQVVGDATDVAAPLSPDDIRALLAP